jgi:endonuclease/exonuclease/phosphatase family metal-dependent hydrolase
MKTVHWAFAPAIVGTPGEEWRALTDKDTKIITEQHAAHVERSYGIGLISKIPVVKWHRLDLGKSWFGLPLAVPRKNGVGIGYVADEPRVALVAELENGFTVAVTHLSFVPFVNYHQLKKLERFMASLPGTPLIMGDLNLPWDLPEKSGWKSLLTQFTYPSWGAKLQFDYLLMEKSSLEKFQIGTLGIPPLGLSDHLPIGVEITHK